MRSAALCLLAIAAPACNWVFGIEETLLAPPSDGPPGDGPLPTARLTWMVAVTDVAGVPASVAELRAISPPPSVKIGRIAGELTDATIDDTGEFQIPYDYETTAWRLVYQLANDVPREVHWTPVSNRVPHATVPLYGRVDRAPIPGPNTTMSLNAPGSPANHSGPRVFTTGVWTESQPVFPVPPGSTFTYNLNQSIQLSGPPGAPERTKGDLVVLVDYLTSSGCRRSVGSAAFQLDLADGPSTTINAETWSNTGIAVTAVNPVFADTLRAALTAGSTDTTSVTTVVQFGPSPSSTMPGFTQRVSFLGLRAPLILPMLQCTGSDLSGLPSYNLPDSLSVFPQRAHIQLTADRTVSGGPTLTSGLAVVEPFTGATVMFDFDVAYPSPPFLLGTLDLSTADHVMLTDGTDPLVLSFTNESMKMPADYYEVVLHRVTGVSIAVERVYTLVGPSLTIERSVLAPNSEYVFEIRAYLGAPDASLADFRSHLSTQSSAVVWTHTFRVP